MSHPKAKRYFAIVLSLMMLSGVGLFYLTEQAQAQGHGKAQAVQQKTFVDSRYQHNHSYPARGQSFRSLPENHRVVMHHHSRYYFSHGAWYRPHHGGYAVIAPPVGLFVPFLPLAYATIWMHGIPYYYANETYYTPTPGGYVVVEPPAKEIEGEITESKMFIYPRKGQSEEKQADDRYECHTWSVKQTNYDPTRIPSGVPTDEIFQKRADYQRAMASCLDGRGYTAK